MLRRYFLKALLAVVAVTGGLVGTSSPASAAPLQIRISSWTSAGALIDQDFQQVPGNVQGFLASLTGGFDVVLSTNNASSGGGTTAHSLTINITYTGTTGANSNVLLVEFAGLNYNEPPGGVAVVTSNASPSTGGLSADYVEMVSGVFAPGAIPLVGPPTPIPLPGGILGATLGTGTMGSASSILVPNPAQGSAFTVPADFTFYQRFTFAEFENNGIGSISAGSNVTAVPAPAALIMALTGLPVFGVGALIRRRKAAVTA